MKSFNGWFWRFVHTQFCNTYPFTFHLQWGYWRDRHANTTSTFRSDLHFDIGAFEARYTLKLQKWNMEEQNKSFKKSHLHARFNFGCVNFIVPIETPIVEYVWGVIFPNPSHRKRKHKPDIHTTGTVFAAQINPPDLKHQDGWQPWFSQPKGVVLCLESECMTLEMLSS